MRAGLAFWFALAVAPLHAEPGLKEAASLYHRGRYDSSLAVLDAYRPMLAKRRDSLSLFQYSGMASARLGRAEEATADFRVLLDLDSLFQFPRNEDAAILASFAEAQTLRTGQTERIAVAPAQGTPVSSPNGASNRSANGALPGSLIGNSAEATRLATAGDGSVAALPVRADLKDGRLVPIPSYPGTSTPSGESNPLAPGGMTARGPQGSGIGIAMGALPLGGGWLVEGHYKQGFALAFFQISGLAVSLYASSRITAEKRDVYGIQNEKELGNVQRWQWTQGIALSTALTSYLYSLIASRRP
jgi:hypothetical protein